MKKIKMIAGITWAFTGLIMIMILFPGLNNFSLSASKLPFMKINPNYSGGDVARTLISANCTIDIRNPVFDGLFREREKGFIQIDWRGNIPEKISDTIDYDSDKIPDFIININRPELKTSLYPLNSKVSDVGISTVTSYGWAVRVNIRK